MLNTSDARPAFFADYIKLIDDALTRYLQDLNFTGSRLANAIQYSTILGGKRIRPILTLTTAKCVGSDVSSALPAACALEFIHAYSLIHDDLPAMDDDDLRRGHPTCHIAFDEATAILAGDALQSMAFELICSHSPHNADTRIRMIQTLASASGPKGMVYGQALDFHSMGKQLDLHTLETMHRHKTGMLIEASVILGALTSATPLPEVSLEHLKGYAQAIGLAFQVQDDILDVISDTQTLGKKQGADQALNKPTYPALLGMSGAQSKLLGLHEEALSHLQKLVNLDTSALAAISHFIIGRVS
jgi:geranylgeranyl pyrophosphate synthase